MGLYNKYVDIDAEEESARRQALIDEMWADDAENEEKQNGSKKERQTKKT